MKNFFVRFGPTLLSIGGVALTAATPALQAVIAGHPKVAALLSGAVVTVAHWLPSPAKS